MQVNWSFKLFWYHKNCRSIEVLREFYYESTYRVTMFVLFSLLAEDDMGVQSPVFQVSINLCSGCNGHGSCDYNNVLSSEIAGFYKTVCECDTGYFGMS